MASNKDQHYVPQFLLKHFSILNNRKQIALFNINKLLFVEETAIKNQAKEDYFYGKDGELEKGLSKLESHVSPLIQKIISKKWVPNFNDEGYASLLMFTYFQSGRTKDAVNQLNESTSKILAEIHKLDSSFIVPEINDQNMAMIALQSVASRLHLGLDLGVKLIINISKSPFLISDTPVVKYNQFLEKRNHPGGHCGLMTKGLQLFFPIDDKHLLVLYDSGVYCVGNEKSSFKLKNEKDIFNLNLLQAVTCDENLYFNEKISEDYIRELVKEAEKFRKTEKVNLEIASEYIKDEQTHTLYHSSNLNYSMNLDLSFIKMTKSAKRHKMNDFVVQLRNERIRPLLSKA